MPRDFKDRLENRAPIVIAVDGLPTLGRSSYIIQLGVPRPTRIELDSGGVIDATAIHLTPEQALSLAVRLTELVGPVELE